MITWEQKVEQLASDLDRDNYVKQLATALAREGQGGWEFVSALSSDGARPPDLLVFKRPLS